MHRLKLLVALAALLSQGVMLGGSARDQLTIDATKQPSPTFKGCGPFPDSAAAGHSAGLPIRLELLIPTGELRPDGATLIDFLITDIGAEPIKLPSSVNQNMEPASVLTLWFTSDAIKDEYFKDVKSGRLIRVESPPTSAELYGRNADPQTFLVLAPNETIRVRAYARVALNPGTYSFTGHGELARLSHGTSELVGTADSEVVTRTLSSPTAR